MWVPGQGRTTVTNCPLLHPVSLFLTLRCDTLCICCSSAFLEEIPEPHGEIPWLQEKKNQQSSHLLTVKVEEFSIGEAVAV